MRIIAAALVGGLIIFVWGFVSWVVLSWHQTSGWALANEDQIVAAIQAGDNGPGVYWLPGWVDGMDEDTYAAKHEAGPLGMLIYQPEGEAMLSPMLMARGFVIDVAAALVAAMLLAMAGLRNAVGRVAFIALLGVFIAIIADGTNWNFMRFPTDFTLVNAADRVIGWFLAGIAIAALVKPKAAASAA